MTRISMGDMDCWIAELIASERNSAELKAGIITLIELLMFFSGRCSILLLFIESFKVFSKALFIDI